MSRDNIRDRITSERRFKLRPVRSPGGKPELVAMGQGRDTRLYLGTNLECWGMLEDREQVRALVEELERRLAAPSQPWSDGLGRWNGPTARRPGSRRRMAAP